MNPYHAGPLFFGPDGPSQVAPRNKYTLILNRIIQKSDLLCVAEKFSELKENIPGLLQGVCPKCKTEHLIVLPNRDPIRWNCDQCHIHGWNAVDFLVDCVGMCQNHAAEYLSAMLDISLEPPEPTPIAANKPGAIIFNPEKKRKLKKFVLVFDTHLYELIKGGHRIARESNLYFRIRNRIVRYFISRKSK